jgi:hypothetical protein
MPPAQPGISVIQLGQSEPHAAIMMEKCVAAFWLIWAAFGCGFNSSGGLWTAIASFSDRQNAGVGVKCQIELGNLLSEHANQTFNLP